MADTRSVDPRDESALVQQPNDSFDRAVSDANEIQYDDTSDTNDTAEEAKGWPRLRLFLTIFRVYIQIFAYFLAVCSIYWGTFYKRNERFVNAKMLVVSDDSGFQTANGTSVGPLLANAFDDMVFNNATIARYGGWTRANMTAFHESAQSRNNTALEEVSRLVHHQKYWVGIYIAPNASEAIYQSLASANNSIVTSGQLSTLINLVYETGRHYSGLNQYITKNLNIVDESWMNYYVSPYVYDVIIQQLLTLAQRRALLASNNSISLISSRPTFNLIDNRPPRSSAVLGPSELGLLYAQIFSFHQFNFSREFHELLKDKLRFKHYLVYRVLSSQVNYLVLSLVYALITLAFQIPVNVTFGRSGFLVLWMFVFLYIGACGGMNEVVVTLILKSGKNAFIAPWIIFNMISNMATTFSPIIFAPNFYRYGYAMPMYNGYEALKVVFFNTWKGELGRNIGVLCAWIVVMNILIIYMAIHTNRAAKAAKAKEKENETENQKESESEKSESPVKFNEKLGQPIEKEEAKVPTEEVEPNLKD